MVLLSPRGYTDHGAVGENTYIWIHEMPIHHQKCWETSPCQEIIHYYGQKNLGSGSQLVWLQDPPSFVIDKL